MVSMRMHNQVIVDVGAHIGTLTLPLARMLTVLLAVGLADALLFVSMPKHEVWF